MNLCINCANRGDTCSVIYEDPEDGKPEMVYCLEARRHECYCGQEGRYFRPACEEDRRKKVKEKLRKIGEHLEEICKASTLGESAKELQEVFDKSLEEQQPELEFTVEHDGDLLEIYVNGYFLTAPCRSDMSEEGLAEIDRVIGAGESEEEEHDPTQELLEKAWDEFYKIQWVEEK